MHNITNHIERKLDHNCTRMLQAALNKSLRQHSTKQQLYGHLPPISKNIQIRRARHPRRCWRSKDELISYVLLLTSLHGQARIWWLARTYLQQLSTDTGCSMDDLPRAMDNRNDWRERVIGVLVSCHNDDDDDDIWKRKIKSDRMKMYKYEKCKVFGGWLYWLPTLKVLVFKWENFQPIDWYDINIS